MFVFVIACRNGMNTIEQIEDVTGVVPNFLDSQDSVPNPLFRFYQLSLCEIQLSFPRVSIPANSRIPLVKQHRIPKFHCWLINSIEWNIYLFINCNCNLRDENVKRISEYHFLCLSQSLSALTLAAYLRAND
jgi:hypothetical protein